MSCRASEILANVEHDGCPLPPLTVANIVVASESLPALPTGFDGSITGSRLDLPDGRILVNATVAAFMISLRALFTHLYPTHFLLRFDTDASPPPPEDAPRIATSFAETAAELDVLASLAAASESENFGLTAYLILTRLEARIKIFDMADTNDWHVEVPDRIAEAISHPWFRGVTRFAMGFSVPQLTAHERLALAHEAKRYSRASGGRTPPIGRGGELREPSAARRTGPNPRREAAGHAPARGDGRPAPDRRSPS